MKPIFNIMIVDDEMLVRQGIKHLLNWEQEGYRIVGEAANGVEALSMMDELNPHIIITDIVMPIMGGEKLVKSDTVTMLIRVTRNSLRNNPCFLILLMKFPIMAALHPVSDIGLEKCPSAF